MHRVLALAALLAATVAISACGAAASPSPSAVASAAATTAASPSVAATTDASPTASDDATESPDATGETSAAPSVAMPSLPSGAEDLEALLPDEICGAEAFKVSFGGEQFEQQADEEMRAVLDEIGAQPADVSMAVAGGATTESAACNAGILRIAGANTDELRTAFISASEEQGDTVEEQQIGDRTVYAVGSDGETQHIYFVDDTIVFVAAPDAELESLLAELP